MDARYRSREAEFLKERIMRVENALFFRKAELSCPQCDDGAEVERLELLRADLLGRYERLMDPSRDSPPRRVAMPVE
jgi:hypothetical protein